MNTTEAKKRGRKTATEAQEFMKEEDIYKAEKDLAEQEKALKEKRRELERAKKKSSEEWNRIHIFNIVVNMLHDGAITPQKFEEYVNKTLKEDYQKESVKSVIKFILKKKTEAKNENKTATNSSEKTTEN